MARPVLGDAQELRQKLSSSRAISKPESRAIFLSHAGKQKPFVIDLYNDFVRGFPRIDPFFDQSSSSLPLGEEFPDRIFKAARECDVAVVILTKEYVTSKWPMLELLAFVEAQKSNPRLKLLPVFFDDLPTSKLDDHIIVEESWVAAWKNMPSEAHREISITVELCKEALRKLRKVKGLVLTNNMSLASLRRGIVKAALKFVPSSPDSDIENIQGCRRLCETISEMFRKNDKGVYCLGLYGMGGLGKTTMCKALCSYFERLSDSKVCHLEIGSDDRDMKEMKFKRLIKILRSLSDVPNDQIDELEKSHADYKVEKYVQQCLSDKQPKFLAVDNIRDGPLGSCEEASDYLNWLSEGSIIVITSRSLDNVRSVIRNGDYCKPIPVLEEGEAMNLFLKIAAPEVNRQSLSTEQTEVFRKCLQICFFAPNFDANREQVGIKVGGRTVNGESGHYHPLALRAVASYLSDLSPGQENPFLHWEEVLKDKNMLFHARHSIDIIEVLGIGFNDKSMCGLSKQLFIDVALFAPQPVRAEEIFDWLVSIGEHPPQTVKEKLKILRRKCFLNYDDCMPPQERCKNISMHDLYRDFAKAYLGKKKEGLFTFGAYDGGDQRLPSLEDPGWSTVPRIHHQSLVNSDLAKVNEWRKVAVLHLVGCGGITTFSIGELVGLRQLAISRCSKLEVLSWTQDIETKGDCQGRNLWLVELSYNKSLRTLPNFSNCSELRCFHVMECSSAVEPLQFHNCSHLVEVYLGGNDVTEVQSLQSCPELRAIRLGWNAMHKGLPLLDELPGLSKLEINGASDLPSRDRIGFSSFLGRNQFFRQHPKGSVYHDFTRIRGLTKLRSVFLSCIPLGNLPAELAAVGSTLQFLQLSGCLLSQMVDFSAFPNLLDLEIWWTNVEEVCGLERLTKLRSLDCSYCFQLQKVPDLRPLSELQVVQFIQCPKLLCIPRLPPRLFADTEDSEDMCRSTLAVVAFAKTAPLPPHGFSVGKRPRGISSQDGESAIHSGVSCDGCMMFPLVGPRYSAKPVHTVYSLCSNCFTERCRRNRCSDTERTKSRLEVEGEWKADYDLCSFCYGISKCAAKDFYRIHQTSLPGQGPKPTVSKTQAGSVSGLSTSDHNKTTVARCAGTFIMHVRSSPFRVPEARTRALVFGSSREYFPSSEN